MAPASASAFSSLISHHRWLRFIIDHNPCYLLSAASMLLGCYLLNAALYTPAGDVKRMLAVLVVVNVYEACVIGLARVLIRYPLVQRDAWIILFVESLFLADITYVSGVISTVDAASGVAINAGLVAVAAIKIYLILRLLRVRRVARTSGFILLQIATLLAVPVVFKRLSLPNHGWVSPVAVYSAWWIAGMLPVVGTLLWARPARRISREETSLADQVLCGVYVVMPFVSLLVHLYSAAWVYEVPFAAAFVAPVLIGLAVAVRVAEAIIQRYQLARVEMVLLAAAVGLSVDFPHTLMFRVDALGPLIVSPLRLALVAGAAFAMYAFWSHARPMFLVASVACVVGAVLGHSASAIRLAVEQLGQMALLFAWRSVPRTMLQWGCAAIAAAFALLGLGAILSRHKLSLPTADPAAPADGPPAV